MTPAAILLLLQIFSGAVFQGATADYSPGVNIAATACATTTDSQWDGFFWQTIPFDITATNTQAGDGCLPDSAQYPTPSLP